MKHATGSPLGRVLGQGAAHSGVHHWWTQRVSAIALVPLTLWFLVSLLLLPDLSHASVVAWLSGTWATVLMSLTVLCLCWHSNLGVQVVIEDYVPHEAWKLCSLLFFAAAHVVLAAAGIIAVLRIAFLPAA